MELFIKNIPYEASELDLVTKLEGFTGERQVLRCEIKKDFLGKSRGHANLTLASQSAGLLLLHSSINFMGRILRVQENNQLPRNVVIPEVPHGSGQLFVGNLSRGSTFLYLWSPDADVKVSVVAKNIPELRLSLKLADVNYKIEFAFESISSLQSCWLRHQENAPVEGLVFQFVYQPRIFFHKAEEQVYHFSTNATEPRWMRTTDFTPVKAFGQSVAFCIKVSRRRCAQLTSHFAIYSSGLCDHPPTFQKRLRLSMMRPFATRQELVPILPKTWHYNMPLEVIFKLNYLIQDGYITPTGLNREFFDLLDPRRYSKERCLSSLAKFTYSEATSLDPARDLHGYLTSGRQVADLIEPDHNQVYIRKIVVTPAKVYFLGPELEMSNRITRHFAHKLDRFLRVAFTEEDYDVLPANSLGEQPHIDAGLRHPSVYQRIHTVLQRGVEFGGIRYEFLAFSSSQLRDSSVWMFANDGEVTADGIRRWMGDFLNIRNVAKCAIRMGQSFSSSTHTAFVPADEVQYIQDITTTFNGVSYCFSDGIGMISKEFARTVAKKCRLSTVPSAFQIRYGGCKGVVAVDPDSKFKLSLRQSMCKFPSTQTSLDVITWTKNVPLYLNRQIINLLSTLGVPDESFQKLQHGIVHQLDNMLQDSRTAFQLLHMLYAGQSQQVMLAMLRAGYHPQDEPYLSSLLQAFRAAQLFYLRTKSHIFLPKGRRLMGCLDEYGLLEYGECFVQISVTPGAEQRGIHYAGVSGRDCAVVIQGLIVVAKNPCLHPGDILVARARDVSRLHHMVDCIVFPQRGHRPHPSECSGSDLDGDDYFVTWDPSLVPSCQQAPMSYESPPIQLLDHPVTLEEIHKFFVDHIANNNLGIISSAHLVHSDTEVEKACSHKCLELAELASIAVDFSKTGIPARFPYNLRPLAYPDFMEKDDGKPTYTSENVIGKLFRSIKEHRLQGVDPISARSAFDYGLYAAGFEKYLEEAEYYKTCYNRKLRGLMNQYDVSEADIMSGSFVNLAKFYRKKRQGEIKEKIILAANSLIKEARGWFEDNIDLDDEDEAAAKAFSWYRVTYDPDREAENEENEQLLSFPWTVHDRLLRNKNSVLRWH